MPIRLTHHSHVGLTYRQCDLRVEGPVVSQMGLDGPASSSCSTASCGAAPAVCQLSVKSKMLIELASYRSLNIGCYNDKNPKSNLVPAGLYIPAGLNENLKYGKPDGDACGPICMCTRINILCTFKSRKQVNDEGDSEVDSSMCISALLELATL